VPVTIETAVYPSSEIDSYYAKVPSNHGNILRKDFRTVAAAVHEVAGSDDIQAFER